MVLRGVLACAPNATDAVVVVAVLAVAHGEEVIDEVRGICEPAARVFEEIIRGRFIVYFVVLGKRTMVTMNLMVTPDIVVALLHAILVEREKLRCSEEYGCTVCRRVDETNIGRSYFALVRCRECNASILVVEKREESEYHT